MFHNQSDGKLPTRGTPGEIMRGNELKGIFGVEMGVLAHPATGRPVRLCSDGIDVLAELEAAGRCEDKEEAVVVV